METRGVKKQLCLGKVNRRRKGWLCANKNLYLLISAILVNFLADYNQHGFPHRTIMASIEKSINKLVWTFKHGF